MIIINNPYQFSLLFNIILFSLSYEIIYKKLLLLYNVKFNIETCHFKGKQTNITISKTLVLIFKYKFL